MKTRTLNRDYHKRNEIIFCDDAVEGELWLGGTRHFEELDLKQLKELAENQFIDLEDAQNCSPTAGDFLEFMEKYPKVTAHGYVVSHKRNDYRVSLEGLSYKGRVNKELNKDFVYLCRHADEFVLEDNTLYSWWD
jgi:hypothetical protein